MRLILLLVLLAAAAGAAFLTRPTQAEMQAKADGLYADMREAQAKAFNVKDLVKGVLVDAIRTSKHQDYTVAARLDVMADDTVTMTCWGAFKQISCSTPKADSK